MTLFKSYYVVWKLEIYYAVKFYFYVVWKLEIYYDEKIYAEFYYVVTIIGE